MKNLMLTVCFLVGFITINAKQSAIEGGLCSPVYPESPKGMNGPDVYMQQEMLDGAKKYRESLHSASGQEDEILTVKCSHQMLAYIINTIYNGGFRILSVTCNEPVEPIWVIKYSY